MADREVLRMCLWLSVASVVLSFIAFWMDPVLNQDGMLYVHMARLVAIGDVAQAEAMHQWSYLSVALGNVARFLSVDPLLIGIGYSALAGLLMQIFVFLLLLQYNGKHRWLAFLIAATFPALADYRSDIIRGDGGWALLLGSMMFLLMWWRHGRLWSLMLAISFAALAVLFRSELIVMMMVIAFLIARKVGQSGSLIILASGTARVILFSALALLIGLFVASAGSERVDFYMVHAKSGVLSNFNQLIADLTPHAGRYLTKDLSLVMSSGLFFMLLIKVVAAHGVFSLPLIAGFAGLCRNRKALDDGGMTLVLSFLLAGVLVAFLFVRLFMVGRYVVPLILALLPVTYLGLIWLSARIKVNFWRYGFVFLAGVIMLDQVVTTSAGKQYLVDAGDWIAANRSQLGRVHYLDPRVSFYSGDGYIGSRNAGLTGSQEVPADTETLVITFKDSNLSPDEKASLYADEMGFGGLLFYADNSDGDGVLVLEK